MMSDHWVYVDAPVEIASLVFDETGTGWIPRVWVRDRDATLSFGRVEGTGEIYVEVDPTNQPTFSDDTDLGDYLSKEDSYFIYRVDADGEVPMFNNIPEYPNLRVESANGDGQDNNRILSTSIPIIVRKDIRLDRSPRLRLNHDVQVDRDVRITWQENRTTLELGDQREVTLTIGRNLSLENGQGNDASRLLVKNDNLQGYEHLIRVAGNIEMESGLVATAGNNQSALDLYNGSGTNNNAILELFGDGTNNFTNNSPTVVPDLYKIRLNKGSAAVNSFTFNNDFNLPLPADIDAQPIEILNGTLILNNAAIDVTLTDAARDDFFLPNTNNTEASSGSGGLTLAAGTARIIGDDTGMVLDGPLTISGGTLDMAPEAVDGNGNNFIQYSASGNAEINLSDGLLLVGAELRRSTSSDAGIINYNQTGGDAFFGINNVPGANDRPVLDISNAGSQFIYTGGLITIVRSNDNPIVGDVTIDNLNGSDFVMGTGQKIQFGSNTMATLSDASTITLPAQTPANEVFTLDSQEALADIEVASSQNTTVRLLNNPLTLRSLNVLDNNDFDANLLDVTVLKDITVGTGGTFTVGPADDANAQTVSFTNNTEAQTVSGAGDYTFWNVTNSGIGLLTANVTGDFIINNDLRNNAGVFETASTDVQLKGDYYANGGITSSTVAGGAQSSGIQMNGTSTQFLYTTSASATFTPIIDALNINNAANVNYGPGNTKNFTIGEELRLTNGQLDIGSKLLTIAAAGNIVNGAGSDGVLNFTVNNMIRINDSEVDDGLRKVYTDVTGIASQFVYPVGGIDYTPVVVDYSRLTGTTANTGFITIKPIARLTAAGLAEDTDESCISGITDFDDSGNVLDFFWNVQTENVEDFTGQFDMYYARDVYEQITADATAAGLTIADNYAPARLLDDLLTWEREYLNSMFDEGNNIVTYAEVVDFGTASPSVTDYVFTGNASQQFRGRYTAGLTFDNATNDLLCGGAIPLNVPVFNTITSGGVRDILDGGSYEGGVAPVSGQSPTINIRAGTTLNVTGVTTTGINRQTFRSFNLEASDSKLQISQAGVQLGFVTGLGSLVLTGNITPAIATDTFFFTECNDSDGIQQGGGLEYQIASGSETITPFKTTVRNLTFSGAGDKQVSAGTSMLICENLTVTDNGLLTLDDNTMTINGNLIKNATGTFSSTNSSSFIFRDGSAQHSIEGSFENTEAIENLEINDSQGLTVVDAGDNNVDVSETLTLTNGLVTTNASNSLRVTNLGSIASESASSYVNGPLVRELSETTAGDAREFPVGTASRYRLLALDGIDYTGAGGIFDWTVQYTATADGARPTTDFATPELVSVSSPYWRVDTEEGATPAPDAEANVTLLYGSSEGSVAPNERRVVFWDDKPATHAFDDDNDPFGGPTDGRWESLGQESIIGSSTSGTITSALKAPFSTTFVTTGSETTPLPVELTAFTAQADGDQVLLNWATAREIDNDYFEVQRSLDGLTFEVIGTVAGAGTIDLPQAYVFRDREPGTGVNYYRLRQVDFGGTFEFSAIRQVNIIREAAPVAPADLTVYPNPTASGTKLYYSSAGLQAAEQVNVQLTDMSGRVVQSGASLATASGVLEGTIDLPAGLPSGMYIVVLQTTNGRQVQKVIIK